MKTPLIIAAALALSACASTRSSSAHYYRSPGEAQSHTITGSVHRTKAFVGWDYTVMIRADDSPICEGSAPGHLRGYFRDKPVECDCMAVSGATQCFSVGTSLSCAADENMRCFVFIAGDRAADLTFQ